MSEVEKKLEGVLKEYAKMDDVLKEMYVRLQELDSISGNYNKTEKILEASSGNLKATSDALISEIEVLKDLASKLGNSEITTFISKLDSFANSINGKLNGSAHKMNEKMDSFAASLEIQQDLLQKTKMVSTVNLWLISLTFFFVFYSILR